MKQITKYINERLVLSKNRANDEYGYIDEMPTGTEKTDEIFNILNTRYPDMFDEMRIMKTGNIKMGKITPEYQISNGKYNTSEFVFYIYNDSVIIRRTELNTYYGGVHPVKFVDVKTLEETLNKFDALLTKRGYKLPNK
jgi:hypothetical protein